MIRAIFLMNDQSITHACVTSREKENKIYVKIFLTGNKLKLVCGIFLNLNHNIETE